MKQFYRLAALFLALLLLCGCAAGNGYGKPERKEGQDEYLTDPVPEGKPQPVEPQDVTVGDTEYTCTISISCASILEHMESTWICATRKRWSLCRRTAGC